MSTNTAYAGPVSDKKWSTTLLMILLLGGFAGHRFYVGKDGTAVLFMLTGGGLLVWWVMDLIKIVSGTFTDIDGRPIPKP